MGARALGPESLEPESLGPESVDPSEDRSALLADLTARIATVGAGGTAGVGGARPPSARRGSDPEGVAAGPATPRPVRPAGPAASRRGRVIGGQPRPVQPAGGHPEDAPGDPATVARQICLRLLTIAPRTRRQLAEALRRREIPDAVVEQVLDRLTDVRLIDDAAYAEAFVVTRHRDRGLGPSALRAELQRKGVAPDLAVEAVSAIDPEAERARAAALVARRVDAAMAAGPEAARRRLVGLLARRGYGPDVAVPVVDEALRRYAEED
jgi:regulatory protein